MMQGTQSPCCVTTWSDGVGKEVGGGQFQDPADTCLLWLIHTDVWQKPSQYCEVINFQLKSVNFKKGRLNLNLYFSMSYFNKM